MHYKRALPYSPSSPCTGTHFPTHVELILSYLRLRGWSILGNHQSSFLAAIGMIEWRYDFPFCIFGSDTVTSFASIESVLQG